MNQPLRNAFWPLLAALTALLFFAAACGEEEEVTTPRSPVPAFPVTVTDSDGQQVTFDAPPQRIVALVPSFVESLFAIGAGDSVVAVDENTDFPPEAAELPKLSGYEPSVEAIGALQPDLIILFFDPGGLRDTLERLAIKVLVLGSPESVNGVLDQIGLLGEVTGRSVEATELIGDMQERIHAVEAKLAEVQQGPRIFHEVSPELYSAGPGSFVGDLYEILKAQNIATEAFPQLSQEAIIAADPEVIILADEPAVTPEEVKARPGWENISAVRNDRVFAVDPDIVSRSGPRVVDALEELARLLYPEKFP